MWLYQIVATEALVKQGEMPASGVGLEVVRAGDDKAGEVLSEPQAVLDAVHGFAVQMNVVRGYSIEVRLERRGCTVI